VGHREGKIPLGKPRRRLENTRTDLKEIGWVDADWIFLYRDGHMEADFYGNADKNLYHINCGEFRE
jgi:hypothetical protein